MKVQNSRCLLLNADFSPLSIIHWKKAVVWNMKYQEDSRYGIDILDFYKNDYITGVNNKKYPIPAVVRIRQYIKITKYSVNFSRKNIFIRDNYRCQYCGKDCSIRELSYDHVIPKSRWTDPNRSPTNWTNIVTACHECNKKKGNKTLAEAQMKLLTLPIRPDKTHKYLPVNEYLIKINREFPDEWAIYLPESYKSP